MTKAQLANNDKRVHETRSAPTTKKAIDVNTLHAPMQHWAGGRITSSQHYKARLLLLATSAGRRGGARATRGTDAAVREPLLLLRGLQDLERAHQSLVNTHHGTSVVELAAIVRRRKESNQLALGEELVTVLHHLMRTADQVQVVPLQERRHHVVPEGERHATVVLTPSNNILVWIGPQQIAQQPGVGDISRPHDALDLVHGRKLGRQASMHGEDLVVDDCRDRQAVEAVRERLPQFDVVATLALIVEAVDSVNGCALVVTTQDEEVFGVLDFVRQQQTNGLQALLSAVDVVTEEQVVGVWGKAAVLKQAQQVVVLSVDIATDLDGRLQLQQDGL
mmetsp:Transcript_46438/g.94613  ORF Transcript_46438/g.94613 Transcript_46438/m.94613 type:complete len:335 (-) Transcript_46438:226-1230(-)